MALGDYMSHLFVSSQTLTYFPHLYQLPKILQQSLATSNHYKQIPGVYHE